MSNKIVRQKKKLLARLQDLLNELTYFEDKMEEAGVDPKNTHLYEDDSSDSEIELHDDISPSAEKLKKRLTRLERRLCATEEFTGLTVLWSKTKIVLSVPEFKGEAPISEKGLWRKVFAKCRINQFHFSITFYTHQPTRYFESPAYRGLRVLISQMVNERELSYSVLPSIATPNDAIQVLLNYERENRSRRTTLAHLEDKYGDSILIKIGARGGYKLTCADRLSMTWMLLNKRSAVAAFYHHLALTFDNMDENCTKKLEYAYNQLNYPTLDTDSRTSHLVEIIDACLEARGQVRLDSDAESQNSKKTADRVAAVPAEKEDATLIDKNNARNFDNRPIPQSSSSDDTAVPAEKEDATLIDKNNARNFDNRPIPQSSSSDDTAVPAEKEDATLIDKNNARNFDNRPIPQSSSSDDTAVPAEKEDATRIYKNNERNFGSSPIPQSSTSKNLKTKANVEKNEPKTKIPKMSAVEKNKKMPGNSESVTQNINSAETGEHTSRKIKLKNRVMKNTKELVKLSTKSKNNDALKNADVLKTKDTEQSKSKSANIQASEKKILGAENGKNNDNLKTEQSTVAQKELNPKDKIVPAEKEDVTLIDKSNERNFENKPIPQSSTSSVTEKNLKTKAKVEKNEPKTKIPKMIAVEKNKKNARKF